MKSRSNERIRSAVAGRLRSGTLSHAVLISGPRGGGTGEIAAWIARASVCEGKSPPCGACPACVSFASLEDLDLLVLRPFDKPIWVEREAAERHFPSGLGEALENLAERGFLLKPPIPPAGRARLPLRLDPEAFFKKGRGSPRLDRSSLETRIAGSPLADNEKAFLREIARAGLSLEWYLSSVGIGLMTGGDDGGVPGRSGIIPFLGRRPAARRRKVVILEEADRMTEEAQNALLKTLEEPPPDSLLLLTSPRRETLLDTIRSRCELIRVPPPPREETMETASLYFHDLAPSAWEALLLLGDGVPARAAAIDLDAYRMEREGAEKLLASAGSAPLSEYLSDLERWAEETEAAGEASAARRLSLFLLLAREMAMEAARAGSAEDGKAARADRLFAAAHATLSALRPGANTRLLLEEFGVRLRRAAATEGGAVR